MNWKHASQILAAVLGCILSANLWPEILNAQQPGALSPGAQQSGAQQSGAQSPPQVPADSAGGITAATAPATASSASPSRKIQQLIEQLGSDRFVEREAASVELLKIGEPALLPLAAAQQSRDAEIRTRAASIRSRIERVKFEGIASSFKRDDNPEASYGLPGWKSFSRVAGASRPAKRLFLDFIDQRRIIALCLESIDGGTVPDGVFEGLPDDPKVRLKSVVARTCAELRTGLLVIGNPAQSGDLIALLVAVQILEDPNHDIHEMIRLESNMGALPQLMNNPGAGPSVRKLLGGWFLKAPTSFAFDVFSFGRLHQVPESADMARRVLASTTDKEAITAALLNFSIFGNASDLPQIEKYIEDSHLLHEFVLDPSGEFEIDNVPPPNIRPNDSKNRSVKQFRRNLGDVALAVAMKVAGMDVNTYFPGIQIDDGNGVREGTIGFPVDHPELRAAALKAYREFRAKQNPAAS